MDIRYEINRIHIFDSFGVSLLKELYGLKNPNKDREDLHKLYKQYLRKIKEKLDIKNVISLGQSVCESTGQDCVVVYIYDYPSNNETFMVGRDYEIGKNFIII